jgi:hypothetical protein
MIPVQLLPPAATPRRRPDPRLRPDPALFSAILQTPPTPPRPKPLFLRSIPNPRLPRFPANPAHPDTCGVHNLHGQPGILGGLVAGLASFAAVNAKAVPHGVAQLGWQVAAIAATVAIAAAGGALAGLLVSRANPFFQLIDGKRRRRRRRRGAAGGGVSGNEAGGPGAAQSRQYTMPRLLLTP